MKVKRMGITKILRRIWLFSANKIKSSESFSKQPTQLIIVAHNCHKNFASIVYLPTWLILLLTAINRKKNMTSDLIQTKLVYGEQLEPIRVDLSKPYKKVQKHF